MSDADETRFAESVQEMRERRGWSQGELARRMVDAGWPNYSQMTVSRTEKRERPIRLSEARALARILGSDVDRMVGHRSPENEQAAVALLHSVVQDLVREVDRLSNDAVSAMGESARAIAALEAVEQSRPLSSPELESFADVAMNRIRELVQYVNAVTRGLNEANAPVVLALHEALSDETNQLSEALHGESEATS